MALLNLDPIQAETINVTQKQRDGSERVFALHADVPTRVLLDVFDLFEIDENVEKITTAAEMRSLMERRIARTSDICLRVFRHTYPEMTAEEVDILFTYPQQREVVMLFFSLLGSPLSALSGALNTSAPDGPMTTPSTPGDGPATKRKTKRN